jgi:hypothetical protein
MAPAKLQSHLHTKHITWEDKALIFLNVNGYGLDDRMIWVRFPVGVGKFSPHHRIQTGSRAHPASYPVGTGNTFPGGKGQGCEAGLSPPSSAEVKEYVELHPHPATRFHGVVLN